jgi:tRNA modification GTPase
VVEALAGSVPEPRQASLRKIGDPLIDKGLLLWFPAPCSFTGEDMAELQIHGSRAVMQAVVEAVLEVDGTRLAEPGEFARRAFENGKLDLTEVEGLADLVNAETDAQRRQALAQSEGSLRRLYEGWRGELVKAQGLMEAGLDFADEADVAADVRAKVAAMVALLMSSIEAHLADRSGEVVRDGFRVVIAGAPNAGGLSVIVADTAGIRSGISPVETEGIRRALARAEDADLVLWVIDGRNPVFGPPETLAGKSSLRVRNKADIAPELAPIDAAELPLRLSAKTGEGLDALIAALEEAAHEWIGASAQVPITRARHRTELVSTRDALKRFLSHDLGPELAAEELRLAATHLGRLTGTIGVEEVLGAIFAEFCIGK